MTERENALRFLHHQPYDHKPDPAQLALMGNTELVRSLDVPVCERPMFGSGYDVFGVHWTATDGFSHYTVGQEPAYDDIEDWRGQLRIPNIEKFDWDALRADAEAVDREKQLVNVVLYTGPFERATELTSFEDCLVNLITDPEDFADLIGALADYKIALIEKIWECAKPDVFLIHDDWGTARSTFMNPDLWREVIKPHTQRIYDAIHAHGAVIAQHSCGAIAPLIPDMVEMGADAWDGQPECNDFPALEAEFGDRLVFLEKAPHPPLPAGEKPQLPGTKYGAYAEYPAFLFE